MKAINGWGDKTSALLAKKLYHFHNSDYPKELRIWDDIPTSLEKEDRFYLPVDAVIISIFNSLDETEKWSFAKINNRLNQYYQGNEIEVWDDLWFWGFITQKGPKENRTHKWNPNKYWAMEHSDKNPSKIKEIKKKANVFLKLIGQEQS